MQRLKIFFLNSSEGQRSAIGAGAGSSPPSPSNMNVDQPPIPNGSAMSPAAQPSTSYAGAGIGPQSPSDEPHMMVIDQPSPSNRSEMAPLAQPSTSGACASLVWSPSNAPRVVIVEHPARYRRFRYKCEVQSAGSIRGVNYTHDRRTYPTIEILNHTGPVTIVVFLVTKDGPGAYKVHPAGLVGENCRFGILLMKVDVTEEERVFEFRNLGIQYVPQNSVKNELKLRRRLHIDPFKQGFEHTNLNNDDLNAVRLCFHVFKRDGNCELAPPVVSEVIYNSKVTGDLSIKEHCNCSGPTTGGTKIIIVSKQVSKDDIQVFFYEMQNGVKVWEAPATNVIVYDKTAISCRAPPYKHRLIENEVQVFFHLRRPSHNSTGEPAPFRYIPVPDDDEIVKVKKRKAIHPLLIDWPSASPVIPPNQDWVMNEELRPCRPPTYGPNQQEPLPVEGYKNTPSLPVGHGDQNESDLDLNLELELPQDLKEIDFDELFKKICTDQHY